MSFIGEPPAQLCPMPVNEAQRLEATRAYGILDTPPDPQFDAITRVAGALFDVPIALVALMDADRLWFKSRLGLDIPQLDRNVAFCAHAILHEHALMVVNDLAADARFANHPLVIAGPKLRFYASAPLVSEDRLPLGTIALVDVRPRAFTAADRTALSDLAIAVMTALEGHKQNLKLARLAHTDYLTGAANRASFDATLQRKAHARVGEADAFALLMIDLDGFKGINDAHGHAAGDTVLREVARRLQAQCRAGDILARVGGDEFAVVLGATGDARAAAGVAQRIIDDIDSPIDLAGGSKVRVKASIGLACCPDDAAEPSALLELADRALYRAKAQSSPRWAMTSVDNAWQPISVAAAVTGADAPARDRCGDCADGIAQPFPFTMAFQPIVDTRHQRVFAYEALVRGPSNEGALSVLEKITARNRYAFDQSCRITAIRLAAELGLPETGASLSINFIPGAMYEPRNCIRATLAAARRYGFPLDRLIFELTEGEEVADKEKLRQIFAVYTEQGFQTAIDDFGAGYSGLSLLTEFQPRFVKLDMMLIRDIDRNSARRAIVRGAMAMCGEMGIRVIAEGVETTAEFRALEELGVELFQGFLFARPGFERLPDVSFPALAGNS